MGKIRGLHSSPGIYTKFTDLSYAATTLGITTLGLVGETLKGPAFEPIPISSWSEYKQYFGGTSPKKFSDTKYPKYELPYIAKSYLTKSDQLYVCRVLGLSGYNAGPAWCLTISGGNDTNLTGTTYCVLRSRAYHTNDGASACAGSDDYDNYNFYATAVTVGAYVETAGKTSCSNGIYSTKWTPASASTVSANDYGRFVLSVAGPNNSVQKYPVSLNPDDNDYIYNVLGSDPTDGDAWIYVEELYDYFLEENILAGKITSVTGCTKVAGLTNTSATEPVNDFMSIPYGDLKNRHLGKTYLVTEAGTSGNGYFVLSATAGTATSAVTVGSICEVVRRVDTAGNKGYYYKVISAITASTHVKVLTTDKFYTLDNNSKVVEENDISNYREPFRCAITPWTLSELMGGTGNLALKRLFRFYTISDGNSSNYEIKISIANISVENGTFDVYVRDFNDTDDSVVILESFKNLTMDETQDNYIGYKIGTVNGEYEAKSKYILVEINENEVAHSCVPCGFLGYPTRYYGATVKAPSIAYNTTVYDVRERKQYFGLSNLAGIDADMFAYKGVNAYTENYRSGYTKSFHLDSRLSNTNATAITLDSEVCSSLTYSHFDTVSSTASNNAPIMGLDDEMSGGLFENIKYRKFTFCPCGGFDGWDVHRKSRSNTDKFSYKKYKGAFVGGRGKAIDILDNPEAYALSGRCLNSDYYAYLAGAMQFENPEKYQINIFATPGIDYVNNQSLSEDILEMIEDERMDSIYVMTTPDKPIGASDSVGEMYSSSDVADNLIDTEIDTYYASTYYPWVKYFDADNHQYINLPATKDVVRNMADVDNKKYPWYAPAGIERGSVDCVKAHLFTKLDDEDNVYDGRINPIKTFAKDGVKVWGNKTMYTKDTPMNRVNVVRLMLYMRRLIIESCRGLIFEPNDTTLKQQFEQIVKPILSQIKKDRGITDFRLDVSQTKEEMDAHEMSCVLWVKPTPALEYIDINFMVTPQGVEFAD